MLLIKDVFYPASYTDMTIDYMYSLSGVTASMLVDIDCACKSCFEITHVIGCAISRSEHNLRILKMHNIILRLLRLLGHQCCKPSSTYYTSTV